MFYIICMIRNIFCYDLIINCRMLFINNVVVKKEKLYGFDKLKIFIIVY